MTERPHGMTPEEYKAHMRAIRDLQEKVAKLRRSAAREALEQDVMEHCRAKHEAQMRDAWVQIDADRHPVARVVGGMLGGIIVGLAYMLWTICQVVIALLLIGLVKRK